MNSRFSEQSVRIVSKWQDKDNKKGSFYNYILIKKQNKFKIPIFKHIVFSVSMRSHCEHSNL